MSCSCLSSGGRTYFDLEIVKPPSPSVRSTHSSSPSSTLSENSNCPRAISTRKPRTPRKRPNQTSTEAAALLSTIYPNIFSTKNLRNACHHLKPYEYSSETCELLPTFPTFDNADFLIHQQIAPKPLSTNGPKSATYCEKAGESTGEIDFHLNSTSPCSGYGDDFEAESILDEELEESIGIDSIMGNLSVNKDSYVEPNDFYGSQVRSACYGSNSVFGGRFGFSFGGCVNKALRQPSNGEWWRSPTVEILDIVPKMKPASEKKKKKKNKKVVAEQQEDGLKDLRLNKEDLKSGLFLKLNYEEVLNAWSDRGLPFSDENLNKESKESSPNAIARLAQFESGLGSWKARLGDENGGIREACVLRYKEKRRTRLFSKKIRYQVRKVNADTRPRMKGRFVRRPSLLCLE